jgi:hypothetical protein
VIPSDVAKKAVTRFEKAVNERARGKLTGQIDTATTFEYRQAKRELLALLQLLRTGENPDNSLELPFNPEEVTKVITNNKPAEPQATR